MDIGTAKLPVGRAPRHHPPPARRARRDRARDRRGVPGLGPRGDRRLPRREVTSRPGGRFGALHARDPRRVRVPGHRPRRARPARGRSSREVGSERAARPARRARPGRRGAGAAEQRPPRRTRPGGRRDHRPAVHARRCPSSATTTTGAVQIGVDIDRETLDRRIEQRVDADVGGGLRRRGPRRWSGTACARGVRRTARSATSRCSPSSTASSPRTRRGSGRSRGTRRFARRQDSWFRKDPRITWVRYDDPERVAKALDAIALSAAPPTA